MLYFKTRKDARSFAAPKSRKVVDNGADVVVGKRWAVKVL